MVESTPKRVLFLVKEGL